MKQSKKDIKSDFFSSKKAGGESTPIIFKNGKILIPTNNGLKVYKTKA